MHTLGEIAKQLNRSPVYLHGLQERFELPVLKGRAYSVAYVEFLQGVVYLRALNVSEESIRKLWQLEKKLLCLLHVDTSGSVTWFLDSCGKKTHRNRRLLLSNYDLGVEFPPKALQLGLNFSSSQPELFASTEMGEDASRVLARCLKQYNLVCTGAREEVPVVQSAARWAARR